jgi:hypothetical protein
MLRTRDLCRQTLDYTVDRGLLPKYDKVGRYRQPNAKGRNLFDAQSMEIVHYAARRGPLYRDVRAWQRAHDVVAAFVRPRRGRGAVNWWQLDEFVAFDLMPVELLGQIDSAMTSVGFEARDRNDAAFSSTYILADTCKVADLPEPYGKWLQHQGRPRWRDDVDLTLVAEIHTESRQLRGLGDGASAHLRLSAATPHVPLLLRERLRVLQGLPPESTNAARARLERLVESKFRAAFNRTH